MKRVGQAGFAAAMMAALASGDMAEARAAAPASLSDALAQAYQWNHDLAAARANVRVSDEAISEATSGYRPKISAQANYARSPTISAVPNSGDQYLGLNPAGYGVTVSQSLFDGDRTRNSESAAIQNMLGARETLRNTEQNILLDVITAYANVVRDQSVLELKINNETVLGQQVKITKDRFAAGQVTEPDVALSQARHSGARADVAASKANLRASMARFKQFVGAEPGHLAPVSPLARKLLPKSRAEALKYAETHHPAIAASNHGVDVQELNIKVIEGEFLPTLGLTGGVLKSYDVNLPGDHRIDVSVGLSLNIPIYDGGVVASRTRQAKETREERIEQTSSVRAKVVAAVDSAWTVLEESPPQIAAASEQIRSASLALKGIEDEAKAGQRTVYDVLNARQELLDAQIKQVSASRDQIVAAYALLASVGNLSATRLGLGVKPYSPEDHADKVRNKWVGTELTPPTSE